MDQDHIQDISKGFTKMINYVMTGCERNVAIFKENLPAKVMKATYPQFLWIQAPVHDYFTDNELCYKFNHCFKSKLHSNCTSLMLKKAWDPKDTTLFINESQQFTSRGYTIYWEAVDKTVHYFDSVMLKKHDIKRKNLKKGDNLSKKDRFLVAEC